MTRPLHVFRAMLAKDLRREWRAKEILLSGLLLSVILLTAIYYAATAGDIDHEDFAAGAVWLCILFTGTIGLNRTHQSEADNGCYRALILTPVDGGWLYLAKVIANLTLLLGSTILLLPICGITFGLALGAAPWTLIASLFLGICAFVAVGTLVVVIAASTRMSDVLFPIVQLPLVVPVLIAGVNSTAAALAGESAGTWLRFLLAVNLVFLSVGFLLYDFLLEE